MCAAPNRLDLRIDIFEEMDQPALVLPSLKPPELITAILQEFQELEYLGETPAHYQLLRASDGLPLDNNQPLAAQYSPRLRLILVENKVALPPGAQKPSRNIYLREMSHNNTGQVHKLAWTPALIGRPDKNQPHNDWLAVNLESHQAGLRVSRRHARITESGGNFYIESLSNNPTSIKSPDGASRPVTAEKQLLQPGELIYLERANVLLKFIIRPEEAKK
jgi:hypothetical protein